MCQDFTNRAAWSNFQVDHKMALTFTDLHVLRDLDTASAYQQATGFNDSDQS